MSWITWLAWTTVAILALPVVAFLGGFTYGIIEKICKTFFNKVFEKSSDLPAPTSDQVIPQPIWLATQPISDPFVPYSRIRGYFPSDN